MSKIVIRSAIAESKSWRDAGFSFMRLHDAPLIEAGELQGTELGSSLRLTHRIEPSTTPAAVSTMARSAGTAEAAGFKDITPYEILDEVDPSTSHITENELKQLINHKRRIPLAIHAAELILEKPPQETIWITHSLIMVGLTEVLGLAGEFEHFIPKHCEIRELPI